MTHEVGEPVQIALSFLTRECSNLKGVAEEGQLIMVCRESGQLG